MKKIMFNDRYGLTEAVIEKRKVVTRRLVKPIIDGIDQVGWKNCDYKVGEIVAVAQRYEMIYSVGEMHKLGVLHKKVSKNKMFVKADLMPHQIRILDIRAEKLQAITEEDCLREGIIKYTKDKIVYKYDLDDGFEMFLWRDMKRIPQEAFAALIDKISGKGTWERNPYVWRIEFELIK